MTAGTIQSLDFKSIFHKYAILPELAQDRLERIQWLLDSAFKNGRVHHNSMGVEDAARGAAHWTVVFVDQQLGSEGSADIEELIALVKQVRDNLKDPIRDLAITWDERGYAKNIDGYVKKLDAKLADLEKLRSQAPQAKAEGANGHKTNGATVIAVEAPAASTAVTVVPFVFLPPAKAGLAVISSAAKLRLILVCFQVLSK